MILTLTNLKRNTVSINSLNTSLAPSSTKSIVRQETMTQAMVDELQALKSAGHISYAVSEDPATDDSLENAHLALLANQLRVNMVDAPDVTGGGTTVKVGFQLVNPSGVPVATQKRLEFAVFDDADLSVPAVNAILSGPASKGTIIAGSGSAALKVLTDVNGEFECDLVDGFDETVYLACSSTFGGPSIDCEETDSVTFSA